MKTNLAKNMYMRVTMMSTVMSMAKAVMVKPMTDRKVTNIKVTN